MKTLGQAVANAMKDIKAEAVRLGAALGIGQPSASPAATLRAANKELTRYELANPHGAYPIDRQSRAALALAIVLDPDFLNEGGSIKQIDHELIVLRRLAAA